MYRRFRMPTVLNEMERLQREMNRLFDSTYENRFQNAAAYPAMNVWANSDSVLITSELPGVMPEDIDISIIGDTLTLSGSRQPDPVGEEARYHRQERGFGKFTRTIQLPFRVDTNAVEANFVKGVLNVRLPRAEEDKPKRITVTAAGA